MKKILILILTLLLFAGCGKENNENIVNKFKEKIQKNNSYILKGTMSIVSNEDTFTYSVTASKSKDDYYKVSLINKTNDHEQVILKNEDGVYVLTHKGITFFEDVEQSISI